MLANKCILPTTDEKKKSKLKVKVSHLGQFLSQNVKLYS